MFRGVIDHFKMKYTERGCGPKALYLVAIVL